MKKFFAILLSIIIVISVPIQIYASDEQTLESIADSTILIEAVYNNRNKVITYRNIDDFVEKAIDEFPELNQIELGKFILTYTGQDYENLPNDIILETLEFQEISITDEYLKVDNEGNSEQITKQEAEIAIERENSRESSSRASWTSNNGYMRIETSYSLNKTNGNRKYYVISAKASWLKMPICYFQDAFVISNTATYDDSYNDYGYLAETLKCCTSTYNYNANAYKNSSNSNVKFEYPAVNGAAIRFGLLSKNGYQCNRATDSHLKLVTSISSYIRYRIIVNSGSNANIQAAYSHKELAVTSSIGISISGISISFSGGGKRTDYKASPVTIKA